ncbi:MAG: hypothetical protein OXT69_08065 [Candidatus Poribacteria bacterium]|nr:hypothetical protein [Candidatus Poribacteria bacterium]
MKFKLGGAVSDRSVKLLLIVSGVGVALFAAFQFLGILSGQENVEDKKRELAEASLMSRMQEPLRTAARSIQDASKTSGETLPKPVLDKMEELYAVKPTPENGKRPLLSATANDLMARLGINDRQAQFILESRTGVESVSDFSDRRRNLFDANADTIEPMILQKIAQTAGRSGIQKLDFVKVEQQTKIDKTQSVIVKPSPTSIQDLTERISAVRTALMSEHSAPLQEAAAQLIQLTRDDPSIRDNAGGNLERMIDDPDLSEDKVAQLRLAWLASQPSKMRILDSLVRTHMQDGLSRIPPEPAPQADGESKAENGSEGGEENADAENSGENAENNEEGGSEEPANGDGGEENANVENGGENAENNEEGGSEESANGDGGEENASAENSGENAENKEEADDSEADNAKQASEPPTHLIPIKFGAHPYPQLAQIKPAAQKRLMETLRDNQAAWLSDDQLRYILDVKEEEPASENQDQEEGGGENAETENEEEKPNDEQNGAQETTDANENESEEADNEENGEDADKNEENGEDTDQNESEKESGEAEGEESGDDEKDGEDAQEESESGPEPFTHPDLEKIRAYHVKLIDTLWRISEAVDKPTPAKPLIYTASTEFRARIENLIRFVYQLEGDAPWMRISELSLTKHNEDGPTLLVRVTVKATIF